MRIQKQQPTDRSDDVTIKIVRHKERRVLEVVDMPTCLSLQSTQLSAK